MGQNTAQVKVVSENNGHQFIGIPVYRHIGMQAYCGSQMADCGGYMQHGRGDSWDAPPG